MRLFIAIPFDNTFKRALKDVQNDLRQQGVTGNYTRTDNLHMTLAFIGEYNDPSHILDVMKSVSFKPFSMKLAETGSFGDIRWCGISNCPELYALVKKLRYALAYAVIPFDKKRFNPHITILRKSNLPFDFNPAEIKVTQDEMIVDHFSLMESSRDKNGVLIYTELGAVTAQ